MMRSTRYLLLIGGVLIAAGIAVIAVGLIFDAVAGN